MMAGDLLRRMAQRRGIVETITDAIFRPEESGSFLDLLG